VAGLATLSLPGLATFVSEVMVLIGAFGGSPAASAAWTVAAIPGVVLAAVSVLLTYQKIFTGTPAAGLDALPDLRVRERFVAAPLVAGLLVLGLVPGLALTYVNAPAEQSVTAVDEAADTAAQMGSDK
jgi:NADH-quinone oxidoreductase subunit M